MENILECHIERKKFCHGYLFYGDKERAEKIMHDAARRFFCDTFDLCGVCAGCAEGGFRSADFHRFSFPVFGIDESRALVEACSKKAFSGRKVFHIEFAKITVEAQNALLKILEEPPSGAYFLIYAGNFENIIETLKSRLSAVFVPFSAENADKNSVDFAKFLKMSLNEKIDFFSGMKDREEAKNFLLRLMREFCGGDDLKNDFSRIKKICEGIKMTENNIPLKLIGLYCF